MNGPLPSTTETRTTQYPLDRLMEFCTRCPSKRDFLDNKMLSRTFAKLKVDEMVANYQILRFALLDPDLNPIAILMTNLKEWLIDILVRHNMEFSFCVDRSITIILNKCHQYCAKPSSNLGNY
ncbi:hypothetical protein DFA_10746 [Cavenderia fasciculata]|uniref:Uncharacterized protein n=1 Tax=Cavenderia fasciculata TaxID=261658 RepID=F4QBA1_CACFS|nr:uncharacterized protein DFA_10746 [Cavenderia fasciculata]EGG14873.1 hypothetical protein DFA_10746 [Cavenderia fasciculata]|eukprot:XP_004351389.1 hypothetical protein DFA_10746 [Cavenderia fasciculata]